MIDIRDFPFVIDTINSILNNRGIAEVKNERKDKDHLVVVEIKRTLRTEKWNYTEEPQSQQTKL